MPRGGKRRGQVGKAYANRSDLQGVQPVQVPTGQPYGQRQALEAAQRAVPLPDVRSGGVASSPPPPAASPGALGPLDRPTDRPDEPLTAGLPIGAGAGPEAVVQPFGISEQERLVAELRGLYAAYPNPDIAALVEMAERRRG